jgi:hypothetical protein
MNITEAVKEYQCSGCTNGPYEECFSKASNHSGCAKHCAGTFPYMVPAAGHIFLGMCKGFNKLGPVEDMKLQIMVNIEEYTGREFSKCSMFKEMGIYNNFNIPVWKHLDEFGNTLVRGLSPRVNRPFLHVFLGDVREFIHCLEITKEDIDAMD